MELSGSTLKGLNLLNDVDLIPDNIFQTFLQFTSLNLLDESAVDNADDDNAAANDATLADGVLKEAGAALSTLFLEAAKHDLSSTELSESLEDEDVAADAEGVVGRVHVIDDRRDAVVEKYEAMKPRLRRNLASIGRHFPVVADADWQLEYVVRDNFVDRRGESRFVVLLRGPADGSKDERTQGRIGGGKNEEIRFACTAEQLQDLVAKLKNACKGLERMVQS